MQKKIYVRRELVVDFDTWMKVFFYDRDTGYYHDSVTVNNPGRNTEEGIKKAISEYKIQHPDIIVEDI